MVGTHPRDTLKAASRDLARANRVLREGAETFDAVAEIEGWPVPFSPVRFLVLACLEEAGIFGLTPTRLARLLHMRPSSLAHHLNALEDVGLIARAPRRIHDRRQVAVRLEDAGRFAAWRMASALARKTSTTPSPSPEPSR